MSEPPANGPVVAVPDGDAPAAEFQEHGLQRRLGGAALAFVGTAALLFSAYQLTIAAFSPISSLITRSLHVVWLKGRSFAPSTEALVKLFGEQFPAHLKSVIVR